MFTCNIFVYFPRCVLKDNIRSLDANFTDCLKIPVLFLEKT